VSSELRGKSHRDPTWVDRFVARPSRVEHLPYADPRNPWYAKWAKAQRQPRDRWWWRLRAQVLWFHWEVFIGLLYWSARHHPGVLPEPGVGITFYIEGKGWIEGLAT
jgi:hypothetical protein